MRTYLLRTVFAIFALSLAMLTATSVKQISLAADNLAHAENLVYLPLVGDGSAPNRTTPTATPTQTATPTDTATSVPPPPEPVLLVNTAVFCLRPNGDEWCVSTTAVTAPNSIYLPQIAK